MGRNILRIVTNVITVITFIYSLLTFLYYLFFLSIAQHYKDFDDYQTLSITIESIEYYENSIYIRSTDDTTYFLDDLNYIVAIDHDIQSVITNGDQITLTFGKKEWGDSWDYPIVMIEKEDIVILDYETGIENINIQVKLIEKAMYRSLAIPVSLFIISLSASIYFFVTRKKMLKSQ